MVVIFHTKDMIVGSFLEFLPLLLVSTAWYMIPVLLNVKDVWNTCGCKTQCCRGDCSYSRNLTENCVLRNRFIGTYMITFYDKERRSRGCVSCSC